MGPDNSLSSPQILGLPLYVYYDAGTDVLNAIARGGLNAHPDTRPPAEREDEVGKPFAVQVPGRANRHLKVSVPLDEIDMRHRVWPYWKYVPNLDLNGVTPVDALVGVGLEVRKGGCLEASVLSSRS